MYGIEDATSKQTFDQSLREFWHVSRLPSCIKFHKMAPSPLQQRRTHNTLLFQKLLNLRDGASPFTLVLDTLEQSGGCVVKEFVRRAKVRFFIFYIGSCLPFHTSYMYFPYQESIVKLFAFFPLWSWSRVAVISKPDISHVSHLHLALLYTILSHS